MARHERGRTVMGAHFYHRCQMESWEWLWDLSRLVSIENEEHVNAFKIDGIAEMK